MNHQWHTRKQKQTNKNTGVGGTQKLYAGEKCSFKKSSKTHEKHQGLFALACVEYTGMQMN